jgi:hypothetical protein
MIRKQVVIVKNGITQLTAIPPPEQMQIDIHVLEGALGKFIPHNDQHFQRIHILIDDLHGFTDIVLQKVDTTETNQVIQILEVLVYYGRRTAAGFGNITDLQVIRSGILQKLIGLLNQFNFFACCHGNFLAVLDSSIIIQVNAVFHYFFMNYWFMSPDMNQ